MKKQDLNLKNYYYSFISNCCSKKNLIIPFFLILGTLNFNCSKADNNEIEEIISSTCYKGKILRRECPSLAYVQVDKYNIGEDWSLEGMNYKNIIGISNLPDSITSDIIYFSIDTKTAANDCIIQMPCQFAYIPAKPTSKMYCVFSISESKCENYEN